VDTLEMASEFGLEVRPKVDRDGELSTRIRFNPYEAKGVEAIVDAWLPFTFAMNSVNRAMGLRDLYPFILSPSVVAKLGFIHGLVRGVANDMAKDMAKHTAKDLTRDSAKAGKP
jgi:hypothetical protein